MTDFFESLAKGDVADELRGIFPMQTVLTVVFLLVIGVTAVPVLSNSVTNVLDDLDGGFASVEPVRFGQLPRSGTQ